MEVNNKLIEDLSRLAKLRFDEKSAEKMKEDLEKIIGFVNKLSEIDTEILKFKKGYETILGERGVTLSGGQVQRLSIARSFIKDSEIYLFDDCFSSLDSDTEDKIIKNLNNNFKSKTLIIVSHRVSCDKNADKIIVLEKGSIIQEGTHNDLIKNEGFYKDLYSKQNSEINKEI